MNCLKLYGCQGPKNTNRGIRVARGGFKCPLNYNHYPKSRVAALNIIRNGGRRSICANHPHKWEST